MADHIVKQEMRCGHVTFQNKLYKAGILFKINSQYEFDRVVWVEVGCGCSGATTEVIKQYGVCVGDNVIMIDEKYLVETRVDIHCLSQDFDTARRDQHRNPGTDFRDIVKRSNPAAIWQIASEVQPKDRFKH